MSLRSWLHRWNRRQAPPERGRGVLAVTEGSYTPRDKKAAPPAGRQTTGGSLFALGVYRNDYIIPQP